MSTLTHIYYSFISPQISAKLINYKKYKSVANVLHVICTAYVNISILLASIIDLNSILI